MRLQREELALELLKLKATVKMGKVKTTDEQEAYKTKRAELEDGVRGAERKLTQARAVLDERHQHASSLMQQVKQTKKRVMTLHAKLADVQGKGLQMRKKARHLRHLPDTIKVLEEVLAEKEKTEL